MSLGNAIRGVASLGFWCIISLADIPAEWLPGLLCGLLLAMATWRFYRLRAAAQNQRLPYSCGWIAVDGKVVFLVGTLHISSLAPRDVRAVVDEVRPDMVMIELDEERLDRISGEGPRPAALQPITVMADGAEPVVLHAARAVWNAERAGDVVSGDVVFDHGSSYGLQHMSEAVRGHIALVQRGGPDGRLAAFALKAHCAARAGAKAVLVINQSGPLPVNRIGVGPLLGELRIALWTRNCGFPPIPLLLLDHTDGERLRDLCRWRRPGRLPRAELEVLPDDYPRRTLWRRLCQGCALVSSGIGILYGVIQCFAVEVGGEFLAAKVAASAHGVPCECIDVNLNKFWGRVAAALLPTPRNVSNSLLSWFAMPCVLFQVLFPPRGNVDVVGSVMLHMASFPLRTWVAAIAAAFCANFVANAVLDLLRASAEQAAEGAGVLSREDRDQAQDLILFALELYILPQIYEAILASRDEAMFHSIVTKSCHASARQLVVVVGAAHSNGILERIRSRGLLVRDKV